MNCTPSVQLALGKENRDVTCYTPSMLVKLKHKFNATFPESPIVIEDGDWRGIHRVLKNALTNSSDCKKEDCWLKLLDREERQVIDQKVFAADHPNDWDDDDKRSLWLSNFDIDAVMKQYEDAYPHFKFLDSTPIDFDKVDSLAAAPARGPKKEWSYEFGETGRLEKENCVSYEHCNFFLDEYVRQKKTHIAMVFNTANHKDKGEHWFSLFVDIPEKFIFYFDSSPPNYNIPLQIQRLIHKIKRQGAQQTPAPIDFRVYTNLNNPHQSSNGECGMYSLFFIITMLTGISPFKQNIMTWKEKIDLFRKTRIDDKFVNMYRGVYFNFPFSDPRTPKKNKKKKK